MLEKLYHMTYAELPHTYDAWKHLATGGSLGHDFYADDPEIFPGLKNGRRNTEVQASLYDAMLEEIMDERNAEKARVRNRRRADRKYKLTPKMRKEQEYLRNWHVCEKLVDYGTWDDIPIVEGRVRSAEKIARADWELEQDEIAEDEMIARFNAELEEFDRKWREEAEAEQRRMREYRKLHDLHEWLKYA